MVPNPNQPQQVMANAAQREASRQAAQQAALELEQAKRRSRKPTDKNLPEGVEDLIIGEGVQQYKDLRDFERRLDASMVRKRLDITDGITRQGKRQKTLRIWISNTVDNQPWQAAGLDENAFDFSANGDATYKVKIEGKLLDDGFEDDEDSEEEDEADKTGDAMEADGGEKPATSNTSTQQAPKRFSHFFKSVVVEVDRPKSLQQDTQPLAEWKKPATANRKSSMAPEAEFDCIEFERKSDENLNVTFHLTRDESPEKYRLSPELSDLLDIEEETRPNAVMALWEYVKAMGIQEDEEKRMIRCDDRLRAVSPSLHLFLGERF